MNFVAKLGQSMVFVALCAYAFAAGMVATWVHSVWEGATLLLVVYMAITIGWMLDSIQLTASFAHFFAASYVVSRFHTLESRLIAACVVSVAAAVKEIWYDRKYETNPPQTWADTLEDLATWVAGAWIGVL